jgi:peptidoglycan/xylan/chitin deacetylase (PgdA/CDA1 family)
MLLAVNFHYVRETGSVAQPGIHAITPVELRRRLEGLSRMGTFVSQADIQAALAGKMPLPSRSMIVTLDDGLKEQYEHAWPVLWQLGIPAIFFVNTAPIVLGTVSTVHKIHLLRSEMSSTQFLALLEQHASRLGIEITLRKESAQAAASHYRYDSPEIAHLKYLLNFLLGPEQCERLINSCFEEQFPGQEAGISRELYLDSRRIAELGRHDCIGTHSHEHLPLGLLPDHQIERQIQLSLDLLESWTERRPCALSYPYGSAEACSRQAARIAARLGILFAFTMERAGNPMLDDPLLLARFDNNDMPGGKASRWPAETLFESVPAASWHRTSREDYVRESARRIAHG